jgi:excisionase family DNA binding protein
MDHITGPLTTGQVAAIFGVTTTTVKRWAETGKLPSFRTVGGHYRFRPEDVTDLKASTTQVGVA